MAPLGLAPVSITHTDPRVIDAHLSHLLPPPPHIRARRPRPVLQWVLSTYVDRLLHTPIRPRTLPEGATPEDVAQEQFLSWEPFKGAAGSTS